MSTLTDVEDIVLNETSQAQKDKYCMISVIFGSKKVRLIDAEIRMAVARG